MLQVRNLSDKQIDDLAWYEAEVDMNAALTEFRVSEAHRRQKHNEAQ
jgi:hypothetical protein